MSYARKEEKGYLSLQAGLNTEASPLAAPEGTTSDELNMDIDISSMVRCRRKGFEQVHTSTPYTGEILESIRWESAGWIVLFGRRLLEEDTHDILDIFILEESDFSEHVRYEARVLKQSFTEVSASILRSRLVFTAGADPFVIQKNADGTINAWYTRLFIRDFKLLEDGLEIGKRPATLSDEHKYNLYNAGWYEKQLLEGGVGDPVLDFENKLGVYPSNADIVYLGHIVNSNGITIFNPDELTTPLTGNSEAPRGHYIYDIKFINRQFRLNNEDNDGSASNTLVALVKDDVIQGSLGGNTIYEEQAPDGVPSDPSQPSPPPGGGGGGIGPGTDPYPVHPWDPDPWVPVLP